MLLEHGLHSFTINDDPHSVSPAPTRTCGFAGHRKQGRTFPVMERYLTKPLLHHIVNEPNKARAIAAAIVKQA